MQKTNRLTYERLRPLPWEQEIIECFTTSPRLLTREDIVTWIEHTGRRNAIGVTSIDNMNKSSQDTFKKDLKVFLRTAENHKRIGAKPFGRLSEKA